MLNLDKQNSFREQYRELQPGWLPATEVYAGLVRRHIQPDSRLLDLGCGRGGLIEQLVETHGPEIIKQTIGLDPDWISLSQHRLNLPAATGFSHALPFADQSFDLIFCSWLFEHLASPESDFAEFSRVLRPGGVLIFITPNKKHPIAWLNQSIGRFSILQGWLVEKLYGRRAEDTFPTWFRANSHQQIEQLLSKSAKTDLKLVELHAIPDPTYLAFHPFIFKTMCRFESALPSSRKLHLVGLIKRRN